MQRRDNLRKDEDSGDDVSTSTTSIMPVRGLANQLDSNLNQEGYWNVENGSEDDTDSDGTLFALLMAEQAGVKMMQEYFEFEASKSTPMYAYWKGLKIFSDAGYQATVKKITR